MATRVNHQEIVRAVLDAKAVDFAALGKLVAQLGPAMALADDPWEDFCGTMRGFIRVYRLNPQIGQVSTVADLAQLREVSAELKA
jgi:hypothetical protein